MRLLPSRIGTRSPRIRQSHRPVSLVPPAPNNRFSGRTQDGPTSTDEHDCEGLVEEEAKQATEWFASLKPSVWEKVVETDTVPKTYVSDGHRRYVRPGGETEPIGHRIIEVPQDPLRVTSRDPHCGFIVYVPVGSIARGEELVMTGGSGKTFACAICHGPSLTGLGEVPDIAGHSPIYMSANFMASRRVHVRVEWPN